MLDPHVTHLRPSRCANSVVPAVGLNRVNRFDGGFVSKLLFSIPLLLFEEEGAFSSARSSKKLVAAAVAHAASQIVAGVFFSASSEE